MSIQPTYEVDVRLWEGPVGQCSAPTGEVDEFGDPTYVDDVGRIRTVHVPRVGDLVPAGAGVWRVLAVQWTSIVHVDSSAWRSGDRGGMVDLVVEPAEGIFFQ